MRAFYVFAIAVLLGFALFGCTQSIDYKTQPNASGKPVTGSGSGSGTLSDSDLSVLDISPSEPDAGDELGIEVPE
ncbi:hypothetical protein HY570_01855 [Candidatus Micrarchaeota archaeon]|nr:hypothetical protein [Candidatus Micrarchaeota archaeon]